MGHYQKEFHKTDTQSHPQERPKTRPRVFIATWLPESWIHVLLKADAFLWIRQKWNIARSGNGIPWNRWTIDRPLLSLKGHPSTPRQHWPSRPINTISRGNSIPGNCYTNRGSTWWRRWLHSTDNRRRQHPMEITDQTWDHKISIPRIRTRIQIRHLRSYGARRRFLRTSAQSKWFKPCSGRRNRHIQWKRNRYPAST